MHLASCFPRPPITLLGIYSGANQSSCFEADPEGCGFYPWLVIVAVSSEPKWVDSSHMQTVHYFALIYIKLLKRFRYECIAFYNCIITVDWMHRLFISLDINKVWALTVCQKYQGIEYSGQERFGTKIKLWGGGHQNFWYAFILSVVHPL